jgi:hypothetical protein
MKRYYSIKSGVHGVFFAIGITKEFKNLKRESVLDFAEEDSRNRFIMRNLG